MFTRACVPLSTTLFAGLALAQAPHQTPAQAPAETPAQPAQAADAAPALESLPHAELVARAKALGPAAQWIALGRSRGGRELFALRIAADAARADEQPAILVVANVEGSRPWTSTLALHHAEQLAARAADPQIAAALANTTYYIVPCANPDAHERRFAAVRSEREATGPGLDDDRDGRAGEDPPSDVNGDGQLTLLRVLDPRGEWISDPADERALIKADKNRGESGRWRVWSEGRDLDRDERVAEDDPLDACVNRNFPAEWKEHAPASGAFPTDEPETLALCEALLQRPQIALVVSYGAYDNLVEKPKAVAADARNKRVPAPGVVEADANLLVELGKRYVELTGAKHKGRALEGGEWHTWAYAHCGVWSLAINPWELPLDTPEPKREDAAPAGETGAGEAPTETKPAARADAKKDKREASDDAKRLRWIDAHGGESWRFLPWTAFEHPELGACEIGGFAPFARSEPPEPERAELARKQLEFLTSLAGDLARVRIDEFSARALGAGLYELRGAVANPARLPFTSASAVRMRSLRPARLELELANGAQLVAGERIQLVRELEGSGGRFEARWLVRARSLDDVRLELVTQHAGGDRRAAQERP